MSLKKNNEYEIEITGVTSEGSGVGRIENIAVFVPNTAIGDICKIVIVKVNKSYCFGKCIEIISPSRDRIESYCRAFPVCGGCCYKHISYQAELKLKQELVQSTFARIGGFEIEVENIIFGDFERYRNKAQYPVGADGENDYISGFYAKRSHRIVACDDCMLQPLLFNEIKNTVLKEAKQNNIAAYNEMDGSGILRHIYIRAAEETNEIMLCLVVNSYDFNYKNLVDAVVRQFPNIVSVVLNLNDKKTNVILGENCKTVYGKGYITDILCGIKVNINPLSFYQVNRRQAEKLYLKALEKAELKTSDDLIDLYCGAGTIGLAAAHRVKSLIGIEVIPQAIENAKENARQNGIENAEFICADASQAAVELAERGQAPDVIIVDPPRKGMTEDVIEAMIKMNPDRIVMISCDVATAARDCKLLCAEKYELKSITPVDMFPRTHHVESVVMMSKV